MVDLHAHILPGLDDGPRTGGDALAIARAAVAAGTRVLAATPHVNRRFDVSPEAVAGAADELRAELAAAGVDLELVTGAEVAHERLGDLDDARLRAHSLGGRGIVLLECERAGPREVEHAVVDLLSRGHGVLLAHTERSRVFRDDPGLVGRLVDAGAFVSITAGSLAGTFGAPAQRLAFALLLAGLVHDIASDAHDAQARPPDPRAGEREVARRFRDAGPWCRWLVTDAPAALVAGDAPPPPPGRPPAPRSALGRWLHR